MIRNGKIEDADKIANIKIDTWRKTYVNIFPDEYLRNLDLEREIEKYKQNFNKRNVILYEEKGKIIGYCYYGNRNDTYLENYKGEIFALYVKNDCQDRGIGTLLLQQAISDLSKTNKKILLWCAKENYKAIKFYRKNGLETLGEKTERVCEKNVEKLAWGIDLEKEKIYNLKKSANYIENNKNIALYTNMDLIFLKGKTREWFKEIINHKKDQKIPQKFVNYLIDKGAIEQS